MTLAIVLFVLLMAAGLFLVIRNPPMPPPSPEFEDALSALREATNEVGRALGEALLPAMSAVATAMSKLIAWFLPQPSDPNPFPRIHLFKRSKR